MRTKGVPQNNVREYTKDITTSLGHRPWDQIDAWVKPPTKNAYRMAPPELAELWK